MNKKERERERTYTKSTVQNRAKENQLNGLYSGGNVLEEI